MSQTSGFFWSRDAVLQHSLIIIPALASLVFCFGFVMMHNPKTGHANTSSSPTQLSNTAPETLPMLQLHEESQLPIVSAGTTSELDASFDSINTSSPQSGNSHGNSQSQGMMGQAAKNSQQLLNNVGNSFSGVTSHN